MSPSIFLHEENRRLVFMWVQVALSNCRHGSAALIVRMVSEFKGNLEKDCLVQFPHFEDRKLPPDCEVHVTFPDCDKA